MTCKRAVFFTKSSIKQFVREKADLSAYKFWKEELKKGYFDDFGEFGKHKGKVFKADDKLQSKDESKAFPVTEVVCYFLDRNGQSYYFPCKTSQSKATLACVSFREGAKAMTESWIDAFLQINKNISSDQCFRINIVEHKLMSIWPFRSLILRSQPSRSSTTYLFLFKDDPCLYQSLNITNKLTSYVFLLDEKGLIRWRACGSANDEELKILRSCHEQLNGIE